MFRLIENDLLAWKTDPYRKPLLVRGARQVGKSYVIEAFGKKYFESLVVVNFELESKFLACFDSLDPIKIIKMIEVMSKQDIFPSHTLLFFDEIQQCPKAIMALRYFKEKMPDLHVIGAGSFLEFVLQDERYSHPVGRVQSLYMKPCSFQEYLIACGESHLLDYLSSATHPSGIEMPIHDVLLQKCREYAILGGMPEVIQYATTTGKLLGCEKIHASILEYYRRDLAKYQGRLQGTLLEKFFVKAPGLIAKCFKYVDLDPDTPARNIKPALEALIKAGILYPVYHTSAQGLPLSMGVSEKKFKLLFLDIGLACHALGLDFETLLADDLLLLNQGHLSEQWVGQELLVYGKSYEETKLFYWEREKRGSQSEVDYIIQVGSTIYPVEVKSGKSGRLKSLHVFLQEKKSPIGILISQRPLSFDPPILSIPMYMIHELPRLVKSALTEV